jgi:hypothetical protein
MSKFTKVLGIVALALVINVGAAEAAGHGGHGGGGHGGGWHGGHGGGFGGGGFGFGIGGFGYPYGGGYGYPYGYAGYYEDGGCYLVRQRVMTRYGWRLRRVQVCN